MEFNTFVFLFPNSCWCLQLCITDTSSVNITCSLMFRRCQNWLKLNELFLSQQTEERLEAFYLCGGKIVDLQFQTADGRLAENDGFVTAFHLNQTKFHQKYSLEKVHLLTLSCQFTTHTCLKLKQSNKTGLQTILLS